MPFRPDAPTHATRMARSLAKLLTAEGHPVTLTAARATLAAMLGHDGWDALRLACASPDGPSPPDHLVCETVREDRRIRSVRALTETGLAVEAASRIVLNLSPTGTRGEAAPPSLLAPTGLQEHAAAIVADPAAFAVACTLHAVASDDPHFVARWTRGQPGRTGAALSRTLSDLRSAPDHPGWAGLFLHSALGLGPAHPATRRLLRPGRVAPTATAATVRNFDAAAVASLQASFEADAGRYVAKALDPANAIPFIPSRGSIRRTWKPARPFRLSCLDVPQAWRPAGHGDLAMANLLVVEVPERVQMRAVLSDDPEWRTFLSYAARHDGAAERLAEARGETFSLGDGHATVGYLLRHEGHTRATQGLMARTRVDPGAGTHHVDVLGPFAAIAGDFLDAAPYLAMAVARSVSADLRAWSRIVPPGGSLRVLVSPEPRAGRDPFPQDIVDSIAETFALDEAEAPTRGYDLVASRATTGGEPVRMPALHRTARPVAAAGDWLGVEDGLREAVLRHAMPILLTLDGDRPAIADVEGAFLGNDDVPVFLKGEGPVAGIMAMLAEAGLGNDAVIVGGEGYVAVVASEAWERDDWSEDRQVALVIDATPPSEGAWERMRAAFWRDMHDRHEVMLAARPGFRAGGFPTIHPGTATVQ